MEYKIIYYPINSFDDPITSREVFVIKITNSSEIFINEDLIEIANELHSLEDNLNSKLHILSAIDEIFDNYFPEEKYDEDNLLVYIIRDVILSFFLYQDIPMTFPKNGLEVCQSQWRKDNNLGTYEDLTWYL